MKTYYFKLCTGEGARERKPMYDFIAKKFILENDDEAFKKAVELIEELPWADDNDYESPLEYLDSIDFSSGSPFCVEIKNLTDDIKIYEG